MEWIWYECIFLFHLKCGLLVAPAEEGGVARTAAEFGGVMAVGESSAIPPGPALKMDSSMEEGMLNLGRRNPSLEAPDFRLRRWSRGETSLTSESVWLEVSGVEAV